MNVLLLHLPFARRSYLSTFAVPEPSAAIFLAPVLRERHELRFVDLRLEKRLERGLDGFRPDAAVVGVNPLTLPVLGPTLAALCARFPACKVLLFAEAEYGNSHVGERPLDFVHPLADALVQPYFLARLQEIVPAALAAWEEGRTLESVPGLWLRDGNGAFRPTAGAPNALGPIGVPDRTLLGRARGRYRFSGIGRMAHLFYTYGCHFKCRFCPMSKHDGSVTARPLDEVIAELAALSEPNVYLQDFEPFLAPEAMDALADAVERAGIRKRWYMLTRADSALAQRERIARWKRLGLTWLYLGLDGSSIGRLKEIKKSITPETNEEALRAMQALGLAVHAGFVVPPSYTREDFAALRSYVKRLPVRLVAFTVETPLVGTKLFDESEASLTTRDWSLQDLEHALLPTALPLPEFYRELALLQVGSGLRTVPSMLRHYPMRDVVRMWALGPQAIAGLLRSARDHGRPPAGAPAEVAASVS